MTAGRNGGNDSDVAKISKHMVILPYAEVDQATELNKGFK